MALPPDTQNALSEEGKRFLEELAQADPTSPALLRLAREHLRQNRPALALQLARPITEAHPYHPGAAVVLAVALAGAGQKGEAERILRKAAMDSGALAEWLENAAEAWEQIGNEIEAKRLSAAAMALLGESGVEDHRGKAESTGEAIPTITLARLYMEQGYSDRAIAVCRQILDKTPNHQQALELLAELEPSQAGDEFIPEDLPTEPSGPPTDYSAIRARKEAQLLAEQDEAEIPSEVAATDYSAIEAFAEEEALEMEAAEEDDLEGLEIPVEAVTTDYSAVEAALEDHDLDDLDVPEEAGLTDYTAIRALEEEEDLPEPEGGEEEDFSLPEPEDEEALVEDMESLEIPEETVTTDYSALATASNDNDLDELEVPEEAGLTDYSAVRAWKEEEAGQTEFESIDEEDFSLPEPEDEEDQAEDMESLDLPEETVSTDYSAVEASAEDHDLEGLDVPEETGLTDYTAIKVMEEEGLPEPDGVDEEEFSLPEPEDEEALAEDMESPEAQEVAVSQDYSDLEAAPEEHDLGELDEPEEDGLADASAIQAPAEEEDGLTEFESEEEEDFSLPEPDPEIEESGDLEEMKELEEAVMADESVIQALEDAEDILDSEDEEKPLEAVVQEEPEGESDWDLDQLQPPETDTGGATDYGAIEDLGDVLEDDSVDQGQEELRVRKRKLAERLEKMRDAAARRRQQFEDEQR